jgi:hypothetical protein
MMTGSGRVQVIVKCLYIQVPRKEIQIEYDKEFEKLRSAYISANDAILVLPPIPNRPGCLSFSHPSNHDHNGSMIQAIQSNVVEGTGIMEVTVAVAEACINIIRANQSQEME